MWVLRLGADDREGECAGVVGKEPDLHFVPPDTVVFGVAACQSPSSTR